MATMDQMWKYTHVASMLISWLFSVIFIVMAIAKINNFDQYASPLWEYTSPFTSDLGWSKNDATVASTFESKCTGPVGSLIYIQTYHFDPVDPFCTCMAREVSKRLAMPGLSVSDAILQLNAKVTANETVFGDERMELVRCKMDERRYIVPFTEGGIKIANIAVLAVFWNIFSAIYLWRTVLCMLDDEQQAFASRKTNSWRSVTEWGAPQWLFAVGEFGLFVIAMITLGIYNGNAHSEDWVFGALLIVYYFAAKTLFDYYELAYGLSTICYTIIAPCAVGCMMIAGFQLHAVEYITTLVFSVIIPISLMLMLFMPDFDVTVLSLICFLVSATIMSANASLIFPENRGAVQVWAYVYPFDIWLTLWPLILCPIVYGVMLLNGGKERLGIKDKTNDESKDKADSLINKCLAYTELIPKVAVNIMVLRLLYEAGTLTPATPSSLSTTGATWAMS